MCGGSAASHGNGEVEVKIQEARVGGHEYNASFWVAAMKLADEYSPIN